MVNIPPEDVRQHSVGIIGAGAAGLITGYTLLQDGFENVQLLTRDKSPGGVWAKGRVYPGVSINNVHGEFRFSPLPMPPPSLQQETGNRLSGEDMSAYMERFAETFLPGRIRFETEIVDIRRGEGDSGWDVEVQDLNTNTKHVLSYDRIVLCTGGCSQPLIPEGLSAKSAVQAGFRGPVMHSSEFASHVDQILNDAKLNPDYSVVVVGGGKSAQDLSAYLACQGVNVTVVFDKADAILAYPIQLPECIRKSRCLGILSPHMELHTRLERFLHTTWLGSKITHAFWNFLTWSSFEVLKIPKGSPLRNVHSLFWGIRTNDEGTGRKNGFHVLVNEGKINLVAPTRAEKYGGDGVSLILGNEQTLNANAVVLATGFVSSWTGIFTEKTIEELGIGRHPPTQARCDAWKHYRTLSSPPPAHPQSDQWASSIYRGIVPAKNINARDFAINGAVFTTNNGYGFEVTAHWISSYFLGDKMRLPSTVEEALAETDRKAAWMRKRFPDMLLWINESYSSGLAFWSWPQAIDELLDDMEVPSMRTGGNWLTWPLRVISLDEIASLGKERRIKREADASACEKVNHARCMSDI
ncbi:FAD/NAD(P)-binding domain-containing protein [Melanogaster broomeanus]|nr:FAD/NAD(P)-binding domain-containing protein [Melanogaster broomeanus]